MPDREGLISRILAETGHAAWTRTPLPHDASRRRYERLTSGERSRILMDAPPETGEDTRPFLAIGRHLRSIGLSAPALIHAETSTGVLILEDLGHVLFADHLQVWPGEEEMLYLAAADVLAKVQSAPPPDGLLQLTPESAAQMLEPLFDWHVTLDPRNRAAIETEIAAALDRHAGPPDELSLRDFHAENLVWRPRLDGDAKVGLLDFQDAFLAPAAYDLASLLDDARRDVEDETKDAVLTRFAERTGRDRATLDRALAVLSVQRNLRILGIFARLVRRDRKPKYLAFVPRVRAHLCRRLEDPALADLSRLCLPFLESEPDWT
ncbi:aminoglycoside phosphotransferase family protein [Pelagovum pacificum]|uniref:Aminoglycoside phosphotransferase n=1 Tax=Pelagovum pacificum TaxID=2588711 RepID=A0A5C5GHA6_9RHOB|nr:phosphotransferase [Pelagovum pacificum]QQA42759.1 phosphotransferase [Pelagovum pacificum]TNY34093.1 aminoglycoside phosphotransferase [Pelagovum pacificum]